jgi:hypothetical protein
MSVDGTTELEEVGMGAWEKLAEEVGFAPRFLAQRMEPFVARVFAAALGLGEQPEHSARVVGDVLAGIEARAERFRPNS